MRKFLAWAKRGLFVLTPLAVFAAASASAADPSATTRAALQRDLGLTSSQLSQYLKVERLAAAQERQMAQAQGERYAGSWLERKANGDYQLVVATTSIQPQRATADVEFRNVRHSAAALRASKGEIDDLVARGARVPGGVYGWFVDPRTNSVTVNVAPGAQRHAIGFVAASGADVDTLRFQTMASAPMPLATFKGGSEYLSYDGSGYWYCSVGFAVTRQGAKGFATAGHCGNAGDTAFVAVNRRTVSQIGAFAASNFPNSDRAWVQVDNSHTLLPVVDGYGKGDITVRGSTVAPIGAAVCRSGRTTGLRCGTIEAYNVSVQYPDATVNGMTQVKVCAEGGDSGGSFITGAGQAQGVLSGGNYSCKGKQANLATSYFQPINPLLQAYGLTLTVSP
ncbi:S1 family peptidase [Arenimonas terrae]|uniref:S1 family peptidase n=1 Tax=Arenimonas terrae TaxID=2546226 RepID=A0A5C4RP09_9GAMM|nr:S1 family peptidase [Arenimonas terrae]TNJ32664.1 S1 family peptidase [Arenimonas terrae]